MTLSITTLSIKVLFVTVSINTLWTEHPYAELRRFYCYAVCRYAGCWGTGLPTIGKCEAPRHSAYQHSAYMTVSISNLSITALYQYVSVFMLSVAFYLLLCWMPLCWVSLCRMSWRQVCITREWKSRKKFHQNLPFSGCPLTKHLTTRLTIELTVAVVTNLRHQ